MTRPFRGAFLVSCFAAPALAGCAAASPRSTTDAPETAAPAVPVATTPAAPRGAVTGLATFALAGEQTQGGWLRGTVPDGTVALRLDGKPVAYAPDGTFLIGFDRDAPASARLEATLTTGRSEVRALTVRPRAWRIENINAARTPGGPSEAFLARRRPELARIGSARARQTGAQGWRQAFGWPSKGRISGLFGAQRVYRGEPGAYHSGLDIAPGAGAPFVAPADGVVVLAATEAFSLEGMLLIVDHGMGLNSAFLHARDLVVKEGQAVTRGQVLGHVGDTGRATGPHLHWSIKWDDARLDPLLFTGGPR